MPKQMSPKRPPKQGNDRTGATHPLGAGSHVHPTPLRLHSQLWYPLLKRLGDGGAALVLLLATAPLIAILVGVIRLESAGPAIYRQRRVGQNGELFTILKFRTMDVHTPVLATAEMQKLPRVPYTRIGSFLRKTSLDELPQLWNVFRGEMSLIGPRPALPTQTDVLELRDELGVTNACPGITGLAQVMGRDDLDTPTKVAYDAEYCANMGLRMDLRVLLLTFSALVTNRGNK